MTRSGTNEEDEVRRAEAEETELQVNEKEVTVVSEKVKTGISKKMGTENSGEVRRELKKKDTVDTISTSSSAAKTESAPKVEVLKSAMKKYCLCRTFRSTIPKVSISLRTVQFSLEK